MESLIKTTLTMLLFFNFSYSQLKNSIKSNKILVNSKGLSHAQAASFLNSNRFSMNQNFGMSMTSFNGQSISIGTYSNQVEYFIKDARLAGWLKKDVKTLMNTKDLSNNSDVIKGTITVNYLDYKINRNIPDRVFKKKKN